LAQLEGSHVGTGVSHACMFGSHCWNPSEGQFAQVAPAVPHCVSWVPDWHCPLASQHPFAQVAPLHVEVTIVHVWLVALQVLLLGHAAHAVPFAPQAAVDVPAWQTPLESQHPFGQLPTLHVAPSWVGMGPPSSG
jgi:hypothetical protein